jgi:hypothetical protein
VPVIGQQAFMAAKLSDFFSSAMDFQNRLGIEHAPFTYVDASQLKVNLKVTY